MPTPPHSIIKPTDTAKINTTAGVRSLDGCNYGQKRRNLRLLSSMALLMTRSLLNFAISTSCLGNKTSSKRELPIWMRKALFVSVTSHQECHLRFWVVVLKSSLFLLLLMIRRLLTSRNGYDTLTVAEGALSPLQNSRGDERKNAAYSVCGSSHRTLFQSNCCLNFRLPSQQ
jgi:hypothetical protein